MNPNGKLELLRSVLCLEQKRGASGARGADASRAVPAHRGAQILWCMEGILKDGDVWDQLEVVFARHVLEL